MTNLHKDYIMANQLPNFIECDHLDFDISVVIGSTHIKIEDVLKLGRGAVVKLNKKAEDFVEVYANKKLIAYGEINISHGGTLGISIVEMIK